MALFGRAPVNIEQLENPALLPDTDNGSEWLKEVAGKLKRLPADIRQTSDEIKRARAAEANARMQSELDHRNGHIKPNDWVRLLRGSKENAQYLRKHGHGEPWKSRYQAKQVKPHAVLLDVPKDGSVPRVAEWQLIRKVDNQPPL